MSGIDLLFRTAVDYEQAHQLVLFTLLSKSALPTYLVGIRPPQEVLWEPPKNRLFDLGVKGSEDTCYIELKVRSDLTEKQLKRQSEFLEENKCTGYYVLLGTSWFEHSPSSIINDSGGTAKKIGYEELIKALNQLIVVSGQSLDVYELALAYRIAIQKQFENIKNAFTKNDGGKLFFYSLYSEIQKRLKTTETAIYTVNNRGGPVYILNNKDSWLPFSIKHISGKLFCEIVNGRLCIKFKAQGSNDEKYMIRNSLRNAVKSILGNKYKIVDSGRLGKYMTVCQIDHDFCDISKLDDSAELFQDVAENFNSIINLI